MGELVQKITQTKENVEKKQALTYEEMEAEREEVMSIILLQNVFTPHKYILMILTEKSYMTKMLCAVLINNYCILA